MIRAAALIVLTCLAGLPAAPAADDPFSFDTPAARARFEDLIAELRCLVCQNQSLADSHAELAQDLRNEVYRMIEGGHSDAEIIDFLVARYGDFVLYRPPVKASTWVLWLGPFVLLGIGLTVVFSIGRRRRGAVRALATDERERLAGLIDARQRDEP